MDDIKQLIELNIIIEGLLRNIEARRSEPRADDLMMLSVKFEEFQELYYSVFPPNQLFAVDQHDEAHEMVEAVEMEEMISPIPQCETRQDSVPAPEQQSQQLYQQPSQPQYQTQYQPQYQPQPIATPQPPRVDEALSRRKAENLSKAFTINDKYRFGQALYFGNNELMNEQIKAAQNFNNYQQAYDLFVASNNWDPENPLVKEFMTIVSRHFQQS